MEKSRPTLHQLEELHGFSTRHASLIPLYLSACAVGLTATYLGLNKLNYWYPDRVNTDVFRLFNLNEEANLQTWFSSLLWQFAGLLAFLVARWNRASGYPHTLYWYGMIPILLFLSLDEAAGIHETIGRLIGSQIEMTGALRFTYAWVLFGLALVAVVGLAYLRLLMMLRRRLAVLLVISAVLFLLGAVVMESVGASVDSGVADRMPLGLTWPRVIAYEELLEMLGAIMLIYALLQVLTFGSSPYPAGDAEVRARHPSV